MREKMNMSAIPDSAAAQTTAAPGAPAADAAEAVTLPAGASEKSAAADHTAPFTQICAPTEPSADALTAEPPVKKVRKQIASLDLMKFMGILIVVWYHCRLIIVPNIYTDHSLDQYFYYGVTTLVGPCVPFFFLVNGYLLFSSKLKLKKHAGKIWHFIWLTLLWSAITLFFTMLAQGYAYDFRIFGHHLFTLNPDAFQIAGHHIFQAAKGTVSLQYFLKNTILIKNLITDGESAWFYHLWFMGAMVILYFFFPLLKMAWDHYRHIFNYFLIAVFVMVFGNKAINMCLNVFYWLTTGHNPAAGFTGNTVYTGYNFLFIFNPFQGIDGYIFVYFMLGAVIRENETKFREIFRPWVCIVGIIITTACLYLYGYFMTMTTGHLWNSGDQYGNDIVFSLIRVLCIFGLCTHYKGTGLHGRFIRYIGSNTMGIYLIHYVLRNLTYKKLRAVPIPGYFLKTTLYFLVIFLLSWGIMELFKRIPVLKKIIV